MSESVRIGNRAYQVVELDGQLQTGYDVIADRQAGIILAVRGARPQLVAQVVAELTMREIHAIPLTGPTEHP